MKKSNSGSQMEMVRIGNALVDLAGVVALERRESLALTYRDGLTVSVMCTKQQAAHILDIAAKAGKPITANRNQDNNDQTL